MTPLLKRAIKEAQSRPDAEQDWIASIILDAIADEKRWDESFARSQDQLARMADKVRTDNRVRSHDHPGMRGRHDS